MWPQHLIHASGTRTGVSSPWAGPTASGTTFPCPPSSFPIILEDDNTQPTLSKHRNYSDTTSHNFTGIFSFFFSSFFFEKQASSVVHRPTEILGKYSILSIMHGKCPSCCGTRQQFQTFQQLLLWSQSCPSVTQAAKVAPSLYHLIWAENDRQGSKGSHRRAVGLWVQLPKAVRILPAHPLNEDLPLWSFSIAGDFSKSTACFSKSPEWKLLFCRDEKHGRDFSLLCLQHSKAS